MYKGLRISRLGTQESEKRPVIAPLRRKGNLQPKGLRSISYHTTLLEEVSPPRAEYGPAAFG